MSSNDLDPSTIDSHVTGFFRNPASSVPVSLAAQQIQAPLVQGAALELDELETGGGLRVVVLALDASQSMWEVGDQLRDSFNNDFVPAVKAAREDDVSALRVGGIAFSNTVQQIWHAPNGDYFHKLEELPQLTAAEYDPSRGGSTALHQSILDASALGMRYAAALQAGGSDDVDLDVIVLTDGENNRPPHSPAEVKQMIQGRDKSRIRYGFFYFETAWGNSDPTRYATQELGIDGEMVQAFMARPNESAQERAKRFRTMMAVMSRVSASRGMSAVKATKAVFTDDNLV